MNMSCLVEFFPRRPSHRSASLVPNICLAITILIVFRVRILLYSAGQSRVIWSCLSVSLVYYLNVVLSISVALGGVTGLYVPFTRKESVFHARSMLYHVLKVAIVKCRSALSNSQLLADSRHLSNYFASTSKEYR